ncbi:MAG: DEAD/DEAH box helicase [Thermovenabulum sp.]|uniref:DEAD/DEAH box helicase n=1 Tax=Thermovenabulum sp. TaxID=3100335 RepID=UPI003C7B0475
MIKWCVIVFDEAQKIKKPGVLMTEAAKAMNADFTIALTGTPIENRLTYLWCIMDTVQPGYLGDLKTFNKKYEDISDKDLLIELKKKIDENEPEPPCNPKPMLRRYKGEHLKGLPKKHEHIYEVIMPDIQAKKYSEIIFNARNKQKNKEHILNTLHYLRSVSLHPLKYEGIDDKEYILSSARLSKTIEIIDEIFRVDEKVLIFLESIEMQGVLQTIIQRRYQLPKPPLIINGSVSADKRKIRVDEFQTSKGFNVMILSPKA